MNRARNLVVIHRQLSTATRLNAKIAPSGHRGSSSNQWLTRQLNDPYVVAARYQNYRARSAFKLIEIDDHHHLLQPGMAVLDCGSAPGAWLQVIGQRVGLIPSGNQNNQETRRNKNNHNNRPKPVPGAEKNSLVIGIDLNAIHPISGITCLSNCDFTLAMNQAKIMNLLEDRKLDFVCSDMAPNSSGFKSCDHEQIMSLCYSAFQFALPNLRPPFRTPDDGTMGNSGGSFLCKLLSGSKVERFTADLARFFTSVEIIKPHSSRGDSSEIFVLAKGFKGIKS